MDDVKQLQLKVENWFKDKNKPFPATWFWEENEKGLFYIEPTTKRKRYGIKKSCECCKKDFIVRRDWLGNVVYCSKFCTGYSRDNKIKISCAWCNKEILKNPSRLKNSKHGFHFCNRECKENAQSIGGIEEIQPSHYQDGSRAYSDRAFKHYGYKCVDCNVTLKAFLQVHHIDSNRDNGSLENLEVVCNMHHMLRHMKYKKKTNEWVVDFKFLTPRDKLDELRKLLVA